MQQVEELAALIGRLVAADGIHPTAIPRLALIRSGQPTEPLHALHEPALCIVVQGRKQVMLGRPASTATTAASISSSPWTCR